MSGDTPPLIDFDTEIPSNPYFAPSGPPSPSARCIDRDTAPKTASIRESLHLATQIILSNQSALERVTYKLDQATSQLQQAELVIEVLLRLLPEHIMESQVDLLQHLREGTRALNRLVAAETNQPPVSMPTIGIANAKNREMSPFSSGPSRPSMTSSGSDEQRGDTKQPLERPSQESQNLEMINHKESATLIPQQVLARKSTELARNPLSMSDRSEPPVSGGLSFISPITLHQPSPNPKIYPMKRPRGRPRKDRLASTVSKPSTRHTPTQSVSDSSASPARTRSQTSLGEFTDSSAGPRRSTRSQMRPDHYYSTTDPHHPSYDGPIPNTAAVARARRAQRTKRLIEAVVPLAQSEVKVRVEQAIWPPRVNEGGTDVVICKVCSGQCHSSCSGLPLENTSLDEWVCPECKRVARTGGTSIDDTGQSVSALCIRPDCDLVPKRKMKLDPEIQLDFSLDRIIGRRRGPNWTMSTRSFEYLIMWKGIDRSTGQPWNVGDATWEPKANVFDIRNEEPLFNEACINEGLDPKIDGPHPLLLQEALVAWTESGELKVDGWSKRIVAAYPSIVEPLGQESSSQPDLKRQRKRRR